MKAKNGLLLFIISLVLVSCFNAPEFSNIPSIKLEDIYFGKSKRVGISDSLVINVSFEDGDGDLGLENTALSDPFHNYNYFIATDNGTLLPVTKTELVPDYYLLNVPSGTNGKLAVNRTRKTPPFDALMLPYGPTTLCTNYSRLDPETHLDSVLISSSLSNLVDESYNFVEVTYKDPRDYILVRDTFYVEANPNFYNIEVHFLRKVDVGKYEEFDFSPYCISFNGRFPVLTDKENPLSGDISYSMTSLNFENIMGNSIWKLRILIRDRALNVSETTESKDFTLEEIKR